MGREFRASHTDFGWQLNAVNWPLVFLSGLFLGARIFLKTSQRRGLWWDDYILVLSWLTLAVQSALWSVMVNLGYGMDFALIPAQNLTKMGLILNIASSLVILANLWSKTSFALTLLRLPLRWMKYTLWFIIISMTVFLGTSSVFIWAQCFSPGQTTIPSTELRCLPDNVMLGYSTFSGVYSAIMDLTLALLPWRFLWKLQMKMGEKIGVMFAMSMGIFAGCAAIMKTTLFPGVKVDINIGIQLVAWSVVESAVSIMAASIPILRALVRQNDSMPPVGYDYETGNSRAYLNSSIRTTQSTLAPPRYPMSQPLTTAAGRNLPREKEPVSKNIVTGEVARKRDDWDEPDKTGYEMTSYGAEVRPVDFTA